MQATPPPSSPTACRQSSSRSGYRRRASKKSGKRKGGWQQTTGLPWSDVKEIHEAHHAAAQAGMPLNRFVSIRPLSQITDEALRKRLCYRQVSRLGEKLRRHGSPFVGIRVFEKDVDGMLHAHLLVHIPRHLLKKFDSWGDLIVTDIRPAVAKHLGYITKQRHPLPPDAEKAVSHRRKKGEAFIGRRWSLTKDAKAVLAAGSR